MHNILKEHPVVYKIIKNWGQKSIKVIHFYQFPFKPKVLFPSLKYLLRFLAKNIFFIKKIFSIHHPLDFLWGLKYLRKEDLREKFWNAWKTKNVCGLTKSLEAPFWKRKSIFYYEQLIIIIIVIAHNQNMHMLFQVFQIFSLLPYSQQL